MKFNKQIAIIMVLVSLLLSAILVAAYLYKVNQETEAKNNKLVSVYIAKRDIEKNAILQEKDLVKTSIAKQFLLQKALVKKELLGKITREKIYKHEIFIKEKLSTKIEIEKENLLKHKHNSYNIPFSMFQNPNFALSQNDTVNIISAYVTPNTKIKRDETSQFSVQYIAREVKVLGFIRNGKASPITIEKQLVKKVVKKKTITEEVEVKADEIVLDIPNKTLLALIKDYNRGKQLWMSKTQAQYDKKLPTKEEIEKAKAPLKKRVVKAKKINYPIKWYVPKNNYVTKTAIIEYVDDPNLKQAKSTTIKTDIQKQCMQRSKLIIVTSNRANIRNSSSLKSNVHKTVVKNYVIPYTNIVNNTWYQLCDGKFMHKNVAKKTTLKSVKEKK